VVFDFDGTLADTRAAIRETLARTLPEVGLPVTEEPELFRNVGLPLDQVLTELGIPRAQLPESVRRYRELFPRAEHTIRLFPGVRECLLFLKDRGLRLAIASSRGEESLLRLVTLLSLHFDFEVVLGEEATLEKKPGPALVLLAARRLRLQPRELLVVGDTAHDVNMGKSAGARTCAVTFGHQHPDALRAAQPDLLLDSLADPGALLAPWLS